MKKRCVPLLRDGRRVHCGSINRTKYMLLEGSTIVGVREESYACFELHFDGFRSADDRSSCRGCHATCSMSNSRTMGLNE